MPAHHVIVRATLRRLLLLRLLLLELHPFFAQLCVEFRPDLLRDHVGAQELVRKHCAAHLTICRKHRDSPDGVLVLLTNGKFRYLRKELPQLLVGKEVFSGNIVAALLDSDGYLPATDSRRSEPAPHAR